MWNHTRILRAFAAGAALTTVVACEESEPPRPTPPVRVESPAPLKTERAAQPVDAQPVEKLVVKVAPPPVVESQPTTPHQILDGARDALKSGELDRALKLAMIAVHKLPSRSAAYNTLGRVQMARGERKAAIASFEKAVELNPSSSFAHNNLGLALLYDGRYEEAADALEEATQLEPAEPYMFNNLGMAYEHLDRLEEARDAYRLAADKSPLATQNLARLAGVKSIRTAKAEPRIEVPAPDGGELH
jgi:Flp pilus assembly protein TadD